MQAAATLIATAVGVKAVNRDPRSPAAVGSKAAVNMFETSDPYSEFGPDSPAQKTYRVANVLLQVVIGGKTDGPQRLNNAIGEIVKAVKADHTLGDIVRDVRFSDVRNFISADQALLMAELDMEILYQHALADPFSL